ncbi:MAG: 3-oxoacyl-[acyl-carrier-protein] synthase [Acidobacteria bacterium]|jgi:3-oxoacyl-[acyl-carrier-protein] synthase II|nr:3-oxoacyl-[acyl-carrier-protein] synthase [Acidobacteriota bacterium]
MARSDRRRVVVTGVGLVSPIGVGTRETWSALLSGASGIGPITRFDTARFESRIAGEVKGFDPERWVEKKEVKKMDLFIHYALAASDMALQDSGLEIDDANADRIGVVIGSGIGGFPLIEKMHSTLLERGPGRISPFFIPGVIVNLAAGQVSIRTGARGPNTAPCTACTTGLHAVGDAFRLIQHGYADAVIAGGTEGAITPIAVGGFSVMGALSQRNDAPEKASRPWDKDRDGFVIGEGAGILVLEELGRARRRGAPVYCEIVGYGMSGDAYHMAAPHPEGRGAAAVMRNALADAELAPDAVDYINAHGTSTPLGDLAEVQAVKQVFGEHARSLAMSSTKSATGHLLGAAGGLECGILALAIRDQVYPATLNLDEPGEGCDLDFVPHEARRAPLEVALTNSFGFGGTNGALLMRRVA